ncbi:MAG: sugar phosphate isomerase/epimerase [Clostridia bacterium]|nr:sugar phosphate isomerase/epimerase [Clostridia bacterium]
MKKHALPLSISFPPRGKMDAIEGIEFLKDNGFDSIDFAIDNFPNYGGENWREDTRRVKQALDESGLIAVSGHLPFRASEDLHEKILIGIEMAGILGLKRAVLHPLGDRRAEPTEENRKYWFEKNMEYYQIYIPYADRAGIKLVTENMRDPLHDKGMHRYASNAEELIEFADPLGLEICWDFGHAHGAGLDQYTEIKKLGHRLTMTHVNDNYGTDDEHIPPYYGQADWDGAMRAMNEIGYRNPLNFELKFRTLPMEIFPEAAAVVRRIGEIMSDKIVGA